MVVLTAAPPSPIPSAAPTATASQHAQPTPDNLALSMALKTALKVVPSFAANPPPDYQVPPDPPQFAMPSPPLPGEWAVLGRTMDWIMNGFLRSQANNGFSEIQRAINAAYLYRGLLFLAPDGTTRGVPNSPEWSIQLPQPVAEHPPPGMAMTWGLCRLSTMLSQLHLLCKRQMDTLRPEPQPLTALLVSLPDRSAGDHCGTGMEIDRTTTGLTNSTANSVWDLQRLASKLYNKFEGILPTEEGDPSTHSAWEQVVPGAELLLTLSLPGQRPLVPRDRTAISARSCLKLLQVHMDPDDAEGSKLTLAAMVGYMARLLVSKEGHLQKHTFGHGPAFEESLTAADVHRSFRDLEEEDWGYKDGVPLPLTKAECKVYDRLAKRHAPALQAKAALAAAEAAAATAAAAAARLAIPSNRDRNPRPPTSRSVTPKRPREDYLEPDPPAQSQGYQARGRGQHRGNPSFRGHMSSSGGNRSASPHPRSNAMQQQMMDMANQIQLLQEQLAQPPPLQQSQPAARRKQPRQRQQPRALATPADSDPEEPRAPRAADDPGGRVAQPNPDKKKKTTRGPSKKQAAKQPPPSNDKDKFPMDW